MQMKKGFKINLHKLIFINKLLLAKVLCFIDLIKKKSFKKDKNEKKIC